MNKAQVLLIAAQAELARREAVARGLHELAGRAETVSVKALDRAAVCKR